MKTVVSFALTPPPLYQASVLLQLLCVYWAKKVSTTFWGNTMPLQTCDSSDYWVNILIWGNWSQIYFPQIQFKVKYILQQLQMCNIWISLLYPKLCYINHIDFHTSGQVLLFVYSLPQKKLRHHPTKKHLCLCGSIKHQDYWFKTLKCFFFSFP